MEIYAILSGKGGTGKTTLAVHLAVAAERSGETSIIIDLDPQGSATDWGTSRQGETPVVVAADPTRLPEILKTAEAKAVDVAVIDTVPHTDRDVYTHTFNTGEKNEKGDRSRNRPESDSKRNTAGRTDTNAPSEKHTHRQKDDRRTLRSHSASPAEAVSVRPRLHHSRPLSRSHRPAHDSIGHATDHRREISEDLCLIFVEFL